jgi:hypothetical protein
MAVLTQNGDGVIDCIDSNKSENKDDQVEN